MNILIVKTSSMGDVIHTLPAITDLSNHCKNNNIEFKIDWVVEESFIDIAKLHPAVDNITSVNIRRWSKDFFSLKNLQEIKSFIKSLRLKKYDYIIDAQGLLKSAILTKLAKLTDSKSFRHGLDKNSSRGKYISWAYNKKYYINTDLHAIDRIRLLFSKIFNYDIKDYDNLEELDYGVKLNHASSTSSSHDLNIKPYLVFFHATTWESKKWPKDYWRDLIKLALDNGYNIKLSSGNPTELSDSENLAEQYASNQVEVMPIMSIAKLINIISNSSGVVCVDTGLGHLAAALAKPGVGIYGATNPNLTAIKAHRFININSNYQCAPCLQRECSRLSDSNHINPPCYQELTASRIWNIFTKINTK